MNRRDFLKMTAAAAAVHASCSAAAGQAGGVPRRPLGNTGETVSVIGIGGYHVARAGVSDSASLRIMHHAIDEGVNFFDNAWDYNAGRSETLMGKALKGGRRDKVFLMTKVLGRTAQEARTQLEDSLRRFDVDTIDLWQFHAINTAEDVEVIFGPGGAMETARRAVEEGKVRHLGFTGHHDPAVHALCLRQGYTWAAVQMPLNVFDHHNRSFEQAVLPLAAAGNVGVIAMKTLGFGRIPARGHATAAECLRYVMTLPVSTLVVGMDSLAALRENLAVVKAFAPLTEEERAALLARTRDEAARELVEDYKKPSGNASNGGNQRSSGNPGGPGGMTGPAIP